jgi:hypothetical protein
VTKPLRILLAAGALALAASGCGGGGSSAVGTTTTTATVTTATGTGGVLGAQATVKGTALQRQADQIMAMLNRQLSNLSSSTSKQDLLAALTQARQQVLAKADRLKRLDLQRPQAQQQRAELESLLRSVAADLTTLKVDAQTGDYASAIAHLTSLSSVTALRAALDRLQSGRSDTRASLRAEAVSVSSGLREQLSQVVTAKSQDDFVARVDEAQAFLDTQRTAIEGMTVPSSLQGEKQRLLTYVASWHRDLARAKASAQAGHLDRARAQLGKKALQQQLRKLIDRLGSS